MYLHKHIIMIPLGIFLYKLFHVDKKVRDLKFRKKF